MDPHTTIVAAADASGDFVISHVTTFPEYLQPLALVAARSASPVERVVNSMELFFALSETDYSSDLPVMYNNLYSCATQVAGGGFWGKGERAVDLMKYARWKAGEWPDGMDPPPVPELDPAYAPPPPPPEPLEPPTEE